MRAILTGVLLTLMTTLALCADAPKYEPQPSQLVQVRGGIGNVLAKLDAGKDVRIAYFGGSITAAAGWRVKTLKWFQEGWPQANISEINAAIGGTGSDLGVYRCQQDVLAFKPDLIFVEFAVNDGGAEPVSIWRSMEGIIRQAWRQDPTIDICYVYTMVTGFADDLNKGLCPRAAGSDDMLAAYYGIPSINVAMRIAELARDGKLIVVPANDAAGKNQPAPAGVTTFSDDGVHPGDAGHQIYTDVIANAVTEMKPTSKPGAHELKAPFIADNWEGAKLVPLTPAMLSPGWKKLDATQGLGGAFHQFMPEMWEATQPGEKISFKFRGTAVKLYDILGPDGGQAIITLDGKAGNPVPRFDWYCTYHRLATLGIADGLENTEHTVTVEIDSKQPDRSPVTDRVKNDPGYNPKTYDGTCLRVGSIMLIGDIVQ